MAEKPKDKGKPAEKTAAEARPPVVEEKPIEVPAAKPKEKKPPKVRKKQRKMHTRYKMDDKGLARLLPYCERCGPGYFMADHGDRFSCGHCGFTRYKRA